MQPLLSNTGNQGMFPVEFRLLLNSVLVLRVFGLTYSAKSTVIFYSIFFLVNITIRLVSLTDFFFKSLRGLFEVYIRCVPEVAHHLEFH